MRKRTILLPAAHPNWPRSYLLTGLVLALCSSCASVPELPWAPVAKDSSAGFYSTARLEYRIDAGKMGQPLDVLRVEGRQLGYEQIASSPLPDRSVGTLVIQQPHPAGRPGFARVTFSIDSGDPAKNASRWNPLQQDESPAAHIGQHDEVHEIWAMDLPAVDADRYFRLLSTQNFYASAERDSAPASLLVKLDGRQVQKKWEALPELNALAQQVRSEGRLVAYLRPQALAGETHGAITSVRAYRQLLAKTGPPAAPAATPDTSDFAPQPSIASNPAAPTAR